MNCTNCGKMVYIPSHRLESFRYCSFKCATTGNIHRPDVRKKIVIPTGDKHWNFKGGCISRGYRFVCVNGTQVPEHRHIMEQHLGRKLLPYPLEVVHHINGNKSDNRLENLQLSSQLDHMHQHFPKGSKFGIQLLNENITWSRKFDKCVECGTVKRRHESNGLCTNCYKRLRRSKGLN